MNETETEVVGTVQIDGEPAVDQEVLLLSPSGGRLLATAVSDTRGAFRCRFPDGQADGPADLVVKLRERVVGPLYRELRSRSGQSIDIQLSSTEVARTVSARIDMSAGRPSVLNVFVDPVEVDPVPSRVQPFVNLRSKGVYDAHFFEAPISESSFSLKLIRGTYRLGGAYLNMDRPMMRAPQSENYVVDRITLEPDGRELQGDPDAGFTLTVDRDQRLLLHLRVVENAELAG